jgi:MoaA/NifB/PqqE/SkfB family radical SAM enzyme
MLARNTTKRAPLDATIATTYRCNSRCEMCNIWQDANPAELPLAFFRNLSPSLRYINLSGGEPFLRADLPEIVGIIKEVAPKAQIIISSNGLATELIRERIQRIMRLDPTVGVRISIDGLAATHDAVRGIPGIFNHAINTIEMLKNEGVKNLGLSFTIMDNNVDELLAVYQLSQQLEIEMAMALVQNSEIYFNKDSNHLTKLAIIERDLSLLIRAELRSWQPKRWARAYYNFGLLQSARQQPRLLPSGAGLDSLFIDPQGNIYPSNLINLPMGNLGAGQLDQTWSGPVASATRAELAKGEIVEPWIVCTIRGEIRRHLPTVLWWIVAHKFFTAKL